MVFDGLFWISNNLLRFGSIYTHKCSQVSQIQKAKLNNCFSFTQIGNEAKNSELFRILHAELLSNNEKVANIDSTQFCDSSHKNNIHHLHKSNSKFIKIKLIYNCSHLDKLFQQSPRTNNNGLAFDAYRRHSYQKSLRNSFIDEMNAKN